MNRREFLLGALAAPVVVKAAWIMPVKKVLLPEPAWGQPIEVIIVQDNGFYRSPILKTSKFAAQNFIQAATRLAVPDHLPTVSGELASPSADTWVVGPLIKHDH